MTMDVGKMIAQGNTAEVYQYGDGCILKLFRDIMPFIAIENEYKITKIVQEQLESVPKALELIEYNGRHGIVYEQIHGINMIQLFQKSGLRMKSYARMFASIHVAMHKKEIDVHYPLKEKLKRDIDYGKELTSQEKEKIKQYIDKLPDRHQLCHFDFHPGNIMICDQKPYVVDWMTACSGDANADVARTLLLMQMGEMIQNSAFVTFLLHRAMNMIGKVYIKEYQKQTGAKKEDITEWILPVAAARLSEMLTDHEREKLVTLVRKKLDEMD